MSGPGGFTVNITNYDLNYSWVLEVSGGYTVELGGGGSITVSGNSNTGFEATVTVSTSRSGYTSRSASVSGTARGPHPKSIFAR